MPIGRTDRYQAALHQRFKLCSVFITLRELIGSLPNTSNSLWSGYLLFNGSFLKESPDKQIVYLILV